MAQQKGIIKLKGTLGDITFYKSQDGYLAREKGSLDASRIATDPNFQRTRENGEEFGRAGKAGKMLRTSIRALLLSVADSKMVGRLTKQMVKVIQADTTSIRGKRNVIDGEAELLKGFEFNIRSKFGTTLFAPFSATIDRASGNLTVAIPSYIPINMVASPGGGTHYKIMAAGASVDFEAEAFEVQSSETDFIALDNVPTAALNLVNTLTANSTHPLFISLGIEFYQEINGTKYTLKNGTYNALALVEVSGI